MGSFWLHTRWRGISAGIVLVLVLGGVVFLAIGGPGVGLTFLGDASAARPSDLSNRIGMAVEGEHPQSSVLDTPAPPSAGPGSATEAQAAWSATEVVQHQQEVLAAYNCARSQHGLPAATLDAALSETAGAAWLRLTRDRAFSLMDLPGDYLTRSVLALSFGPPDAPAAPETGPGGTTAASAPGCAVGGFDAATLPLVPQAHTIGIAVFPPQARWDGASAIVLVKE